MTTAPSPSKKTVTPLFNREGLKAWGIAVGVLLAYATLATFAFYMVTHSEKERDGFQAIEVEKPISFIDKTYLPEKKPVLPAQTP